MEGVEVRQCYGGGGKAVLVRQCYGGGGGMEV